MVTDEQVKRLWQVLSSGKTLVQSADKSSMDAEIREAVGERPGRH